MYICEKEEKFKRGIVNSILRCIKCIYIYKIEDREDRSFIDVPLVSKDKKKKI